VSCQAPIDSPLHEPVVIAAIAQAAINQGVGVRIDTPAHISAVRQQVKVPMIGLEATAPWIEVYITPLSPCCGDLSSWSRYYRHRCHSENRPGGETVTSMISHSRELGKPVMADVDN